jgi:hypothetical protein
MLALFVGNYDPASFIYEISAGVFTITVSMMKELRKATEA